MRLPAIAAVTATNSPTPPTLVRLTMIVLIMSLLAAASHNAILRAMRSLSVNASAGESTCSGMPTSCASASVICRVTRLVFFALAFGLTSAVLSAILYLHNK